MNDAANMWFSEDVSEAEATSASSPLSGGTREADRHGKQQANTTVGIVDPRSLTREGLVKLLESTGRFGVLAVARPADLLTKASEDRISVGVILVGLGSTRVSDEAVRSDIALLIKALPEVPIIVLCDLQDSQHIGEALRQGIRGYIPTTLTSRILIEALRLIQAGGTFIPADALSEALSDRRRAAAETNSVAARLGTCRTHAASEPSARTAARRQAEQDHRIRAGHARKHGQSARPADHAQTAGDQPNRGGVFGLQSPVHLRERAFANLPATRTEQIGSE